METTIKDKLVLIQTELKAPKGQTNAFGKYKYRSCEDILQGLKPLLKKHKAVILLSDELVLVGTRYYVKATAALSDKEGQIQVSAYARESEVKKGMDSAQITGAASSYARKYALNGLLAIDDTKDADTKKPVAEEPTLDWLKKIDEFVKENAIEGESPDDAFDRLTNNADQPKDQKTAQVYYAKLLKNKQNG